jgi:hypothetical protein
MRLVPSSDTVPTSVNKYLLPHERQVITVRQHPAVLIRRIVEALVGLALAGFLSNTVSHGNSYAILVIWGLWAVLLVRLIMKVFEWSVNYFVVTSQRMLLASGIITRKVNMMPLAKVTDMSFQRARTRRCASWTTCPIPNSSTLRCAGSSSRARTRTTEPRHTDTRMTPAAASTRPTCCTTRMRSRSTNRASSTVAPGYSDVITTASPNIPIRVAST